MSEDLIEVTVGAPAHGGHCVARVDGRVIFVRHALPGEVVKIRLTESEPDARLWRADAVEVIEASSDRVDSTWPEAGPGGVGGGELAHVSLSGQRAWKRAVLQESFERFAGQDFPGEVHAAPGDDERGGLRYRTRVSATANASGNAAMRGHRSKEAIALSSMPLATEQIEEELLTHRWPAGSRITIAQGSDGTVRTTVGDVPWSNGKPDRRKNAATTVRQHVEWNGHTFDYRVNAGGFWQVHREAPNVLVSEVMSRIRDAETVADLYGGAGLFALPLGAAGKNVTSIESDGASSRAARRNCHEYPSVTVLPGDVRRHLTQGIGSRDAIVLDPPRSGAGAKTLQAMAEHSPATVVYVACDPVALARDSKTMAEMGYALTDATAYDLFPMTHHVETVATFVRR
ncbi:class I SAM-dependent RNA methyltransferase [Demequina sediminicola]|uniref:class I SAM-dependent RNA methyltransferase n=1 Tax=Demequina sediminicola TaxID=1095026 RepID=UPI000785C22F|nr:TRAM domain-containing protein [Demequina sediminicola]